MRILFLTHRVPYPPDRGDRIRSFNFIKHLSIKHEIDLMSVSFEIFSSAEVKKNLERLCRSVNIFSISYKKNIIKAIPFLFTKIPLTISMFYSDELHVSLRERLRYEKYDLIYIYSSSMAQYVNKVYDTPKVMDFIDVDSEKWNDYAQRAWGIKKWIYKREARFLRNFEISIERHCQASVLVSPAEVSLFKSFAPDAELLYNIPNGVDLPKEQKHIFSGGKENNRIVFVGVMDYFPNIDAVKWFAREIFPYILKKKPEAEFFIVGKNPSREVKELTKEINNIHVTGYVSDIMEYLTKAKVAVIPLKIARGIQNKVLEAMAAGVPVVATSAAIEGIDVVIGHNILVADNAKDFSSNILELMENNKLSQKIATNAVNLIKEKYAWESKVQDLEELMTKVVIDWNVQPLTTDN